MLEFTLELEYTLGVDEFVLQWSTPPTERRGGTG
jgi:hypothetical protein